jgi:hypothetical protein
LLNGAPTITDAGEGITLFSWDGTSDVVTDVDMVTAGFNPSESPDNRLANKSTIRVDGPDIDLLDTMYQPDAFTIGDLPANSPATNLSFQRVLLEDGHERRGMGGNGMFGDDETSEDIRATWSQPSDATPGTIPESLRP